MGYWWYWLLHPLKFTKTNLLPIYSPIMESFSWRSPTGYWPSTPNKQASWCCLLMPPVNDLQVSLLFTKSLQPLSTQPYSDNPFPPACPIYSAALLPIIPLYLFFFKSFLHCLIFDILGNPSLFYTSILGLACALIAECLLNTYINKQLLEYLLLGHCCFFLILSLCVFCYTQYAVFKSFQIRNY